METILRYLWDRLTSPSAWIAGGLWPSVLDQIHLHGLTFQTLSAVVALLLGTLLPSIPKLSVQAPLSPSAIIKTNEVAQASGTGIQGPGNVTSASGGSTNLSSR